jgi:histone-lysine N-methyltransferase SETD2
MPAHDNADSEPTSTKMDSPAAVNGHSHTSLKNNGHSSRSSRSPHPRLKKETSTDANTPPIDSPGKTPSSDPGAIKDDSEMKQETVGGDIVVKQEPGQPPKLSRSSSQKVARGPPQLFSHLPDSTADALATFEQIESCWYANKYMGYTEHAMECDCAEEWGMYSFFMSGFGFLSILNCLPRCGVATWTGEGKSFLAWWKPP